MKNFSSVVKFLPYFATVIVLSLVFLSCMTGSGDCPKVFVMEIGSGGGFTGMWNGYTVKGDCSVYSWSGHKQGEQLEEKGKISEGKLESIWSELNSIKFFELNMQKPGNMSKSIKVTVGEKTNFVVWEAFTEDASLKKLNNLYDDIYKEIESKK